MPVRCCGIWLLPAYTTAFLTHQAEPISRIFFYFLRCTKFFHLESLHRLLNFSPSGLSLYNIPTEVHFVLLSSLKAIFPFPAQYLSQVILNIDVHSLTQEVSSQYILGTVLTTQTKLYSFNLRSGSKPRKAMPWQYPLHLTVHTALKIMLAQS